MNMQIPIEWRVSIARVYKNVNSVHKYYILSRNRFLFYKNFNCLKKHLRLSRLKMLDFSYSWKIFSRHILQMWKHRVWSSPKIMPKATWPQRSVMAESRLPSHPVQPECKRPRGHYACLLCTLRSRLNTRWMQLAAEYFCWSSSSLKLIL